MGQADFPDLDPEFLRPCQAAPTEGERWLAAPVWQHFNVLPANTPDPGAERLHDRLLCGEAGSQGHWARGVSLSLCWGVDALKEAITPPVERGDDPRHLDDIYPTEWPTADLIHVLLR